MQRCKKIFGIAKIGALFSDILPTAFGFCEKAELKYIADVL